MIISRFYLIKGDNKPIYVGFTNRTVKQRFSEHKADKDFSRFDKVTIQELDKLEYNFTWNENELYKNANEVSVREAQLVEQYGTQDSPYQKAIGGGQVWTYEKWFVSTNKDNPKFLGMTSEQVEEYLSLRHEIKQKISNYIGHTMLPEERKIKDYIKITMLPEEQKIKSYIGHTLLPEEQKIKHYIGHTILIEERKIKSYISNTILIEEQKIKNYIKITMLPEERKIKSYIGNTILPEERKIKDYIGHTLLPEEQKIKSYIGHTKGNLK